MMQDAVSRRQLYSGCAELLYLRNTAAPRYYLRYSGTDILLRDTTTVIRDIPGQGHV